jgi:hypothetical protein
MKSIAALFVVFAVSFGGTPTWACPQCRPLVRAGVYNPDFAANLFVLLLPLAVLGAIGVAVHFSDAIPAKVRQIKGCKPWRRICDAGR